MRKYAEKLNEERECNIFLLLYLMVKFHVIRCNVGWFSYTIIHLIVMMNCHTHWNETKGNKH